MIHRHRVLGVCGADTLAVEAVLDRYADACHLPLARSVVKGPSGALGLLLRADAVPPVERVESPEDGTVLVVDGEIFERGGAGLALERFRSGGLEALGAIDAEASFVVWSPVDGALHLVRDRAGHGALHWWQAPEGVVWSDDLPTLLRAGLPREIDLVGVDLFLAQARLPAPQSFVVGAEKVPAGHAVVVRPGRRPTTLATWAPRTEPKWEFSDREVEDRLQAALVAAVGRRSPASGPVAALLSAGVDSSLLVALARVVLGLEVDAFTFRYRGYEGQHNEEPGARRLADAVGARHHLLEIGPEQLAEALPGMVAAAGEPFSFGLHSFTLGEIRDHGFGSVLIGHGPDDWYEVPAHRRGAAVWSRLPASAQRLGEAAVEQAGTVAWGRTHPVRRAANLAMAGTDAVVTSAPRRRRLLVEPSVVSAGQRRSLELVTAARARYADASPMDRERLVLSELLVPEMVRSCLARWGRSHDLALRYPYLDREVVDVALRIDRRGTGKEHLRAIASRLMPPERASAPKLHQTIPLSSWFRGPLRGLLLDGLAPERLAPLGTFEPAAVQSLVQEHLAGRRDHLWLLWCLLVVTEWQERVLRAS